MNRKLLRLAGGGLIVLGILLVAVGIVLFTLPNSYEAVLRVNVEQFSMERQGFDPFSLPEFETLQSKTILYRVITNLNLDRKWAEKRKLPEPLRIEVAYAQLKKKIEIRQTPGASLIEIKVESEEEDEAAAIANEVAEVYRGHRVERRREMTQADISMLERELVRVNRALTNKQAEVEASKASSGSNASEARALSDLKRQRVKLSTRIIQEKEELRTSLVEIIDRPTPPLRRRYPHRGSAIIDLLAGLGAIAMGTVMLRKGKRPEPLNSPEDPTFH